MHYSHECTNPNALFCSVCDTNTSKDTDRLEWVVKKRNYQLYADKLCELHPTTTHEAIDAAMAETLKREG